MNTYLQIVMALGLMLNDLFYDEVELILSSKEFDLDKWLSGCDKFEKAVLLDSLHAIKPILKKRMEMIDY